MLLYTIIAGIATKLYMKLSVVDTIKLCVMLYVGWLLLTIMLI